MRILITGGAGFVGSSLALAFMEENPANRVVVFDNLRRRGSEENLSRFARRGIEFVHGDIRSWRDLEALPGTFDLFVEASAEPSVLAGLDGSPHYVVETNLCGTLNCLELARHRAKNLVFLSSSRVYSIRPLQELGIRETETRFEIRRAQSVPGAGPAGIAETFPTHLPRSLYGATKLASELILQEYVETYGLRAVIDRCGVIAGPGQFGKVEQGVFTYWVARHYYGRPLRYTGYGGTGKQVRDLLHPEDLFRLLLLQVEQLERCAGEVFNVGGGWGCSTSLLEWTGYCKEVTGREIPIASVAETSSVDIPCYVSDTGKARQWFGWSPRKKVLEIASEIRDWIHGDPDHWKALFKV